MTKTVVSCCSAPFCLEGFTLFGCFRVRLKTVICSLLKNEMLTESRAATNELSSSVAGCANFIRFIPWNLDVCRRDRRWCLIHKQVGALWDVFMHREALGWKPVLCRFSPDQSIPAFSLHPKWYLLYTGIFDVDSREAAHCWRPLAPLLMISAQARAAALMSCITVAFFPCRCQLYTVSFFGTMDHLFPWRDTRRRFRKINTWTLVCIDVLFRLVLRLETASFCSVYSSASVRRHNVVEWTSRCVCVGSAPVLSVSFYCLVFWLFVQSCHRGMEIHHLSLVVKCVGSQTSIHTHILTLRRALYSGQSLQ